MNQSYEAAFEKKIGVISIHYGVNFGSSLQAYALCTYIRKNFDNVHVEVINYIPQRFRFKNRYCLPEKKSIVNLARFGVRTARSMHNNWKYERFLQRKVVASNKIYSIEQAQKTYLDYNYLITGSDQVWNSDYNKGVDPMYYLQFAPKKAKKIAYAASCGKNSYTDEEWSTIKKYLLGFDAISLRESSAVSMMDDHGIKKCEFVLDPTYLLSISEWSEIEKSVDGCPQKYLLIYFLDTDGKEIVDMAKRIAREKKLKTVLILNTKSRHKYDVDFEAYAMTPDRYISLFRNASFIVTNSFHGVSFSINMERQFVALKRDKYNSRLDSILNAVGLVDRYVSLGFDGKSDNVIDYVEVNKKKSILLLQSKDFIKKAIES